MSTGTQHDPHADLRKDASFAAIATFAPYALEAVGLLTKFIQTLGKDEIDPNDVEAIQAMVRRFDASKAERESVLDQALAIAQAGKDPGQAV